MAIEERDYVSYEHRPKKGDHVIIHGELKIVKEANWRMRIVFENGEWYYLESLIQVKAYFL